MLSKSMMNGYKFWFKIVGVCRCVGRGGGGGSDWIFILKDISEEDRYKVKAGILRCFPLKKMAIMFWVNLCEHII